MMNRYRRELDSPPASLPAPDRPRPEAIADVAMAGLGDIEHLDVALTRLEIDLLQRALVHTHGNKRLAAQILGISRRSIYRRLERTGLR